MDVHTSQQSRCVSISYTNACNEIGGQVVSVISMPWYNLFITDVPIQKGYTDYTEITKRTESGAISNLCW